MSKILHSVMLVMSNIDGNNNKFWSAELHSDFSVHVKNGRVGAAGQNQPVKNFTTEQSAMKFLESKKSEKLKKGYSEFKGITEAGPTGNSKPLSTLTLEKLAADQIRSQGDKSVIEELVKKLAKANIHNILEHTDLKYDEGTGLFKTPIGFVTQDTIDEARALLVDIGTQIAANNFDGDDIKQHVNRYLMLIPQKVGSKLTVRSVFPNQDSLMNHSGILDGLQSSLQQLQSIKDQPSKHDNAQPAPSLFNCEVTLVTDPTVIATIHDLYNSTRQSMHAANKLRVNRVFSITIDSMEQGFTEFGITKGNVQRLWHGTRVGNVLSILKSGLFIPPSNASYVCGRMFGNGLYFSDQSTKSLNYAYGYWDGRSKDDTCYMFLFDVAMGNSYTPPRSSSSLPMPGYDSTFAKAKESGVMNNEMIVYDVRQATPRFLVEFTL